METINTQEQLIIGSLLGDAGLCMHKNAKNAYLYEHHGIKQRDYLNYKHSLLAEFCNSPPRTSRQFNKQYGKWYESVLLRTRCLERFTGLWKKWYRNGRKIVPTDELEKLDPFGLSIWFSDDGGRRCATLLIATCAFSVEENETLRNFLHRKFDLLADIKKAKSNPELVFSKSSMRQLAAIIDPYLHETMRYKTQNLPQRQRHFTLEEATEIRRRYRVGGCTLRSLAKEYEVCSATIFKTLHGKYKSRDPYEWH